MLRAVTLLAVAVSVGALTSFPGHKVIQIETPTFEDAEWVTNFVEEHNLDMWLRPKIGGHAHVMLDKDQLTNLDLPEYTVFEEDVQSMIDRSFKRAAPAQSWHEEYHDLAEINRWFEELAVQYSNVTGINSEFFTIGNSFQGRPINGIKFGGSSVQNPVQVVWIGVHHAREWIGPATLMFMLDEMFSGFNTDAVLTNLMLRAEFLVIPVLNPDGYEYTWTTNRLWRKTRSQYAGSSAFGTDPNRNWDYQWGGVGASTNPSSDTYRGPFAASEPEIAQLQAFLEDLPNFKSFLDWHSYGQYILSPWGYTSALPAAYQAQMDLMNRMNNAIAPVNGRPYRFGPSGATLYPTSGTAPDYTYGHNGVVDSYTIESPGNPGGFILPPEYIIGVGEESLAGSIVSVENVLAKFDSEYVPVQH